MAGFAGLSAGMVFAVDLRKACRLGDVGFVATRAKSRRVGQLWSHVGRVGRVIRERTVAGLAVHAGVLARLLEGDHVVVAVLTDLMSGELDGPRGDLGEGITAKVAVPAEAAGNQHGSDGEEDGNSCDKYGCNPEEVLVVLEPIHGAIPLGLEFGRKSGP